MFVMFLCSEEIIEYINTTLNPVNTVLQFVIDSSYVLVFQKATLSSLIGAFQILYGPCLLGSPRLGLEICQVLLSLLSCSFHLV